MALALGTPVVDATGTFVTVPVTGATLPLVPKNNVSGFVLKDGGKEVDCDYQDTVGANVLLVPRQVIKSGDTITLDVDGSNLADSAGTPNTLANVTAAAVTNNSTATGQEVPLKQANTEKSYFNEKTGDSV